MLWTKQQHFCFMTMFSLFLEVSGWLKAFGLVAVWAEIQTCICPVADGFVSLLTPHCHSLTPRAAAFPVLTFRKFLVTAECAPSAVSGMEGMVKHEVGGDPSSWKCLWWEGGQSANKQTKQCERFALMKEVRETRLTACKWLVQLKDRIGIRQKRKI